MKQLLYFILLFGVFGIFGVSCSDDDDNNPGGGNTSGGSCTGSSILFKLFK